MIWLLELRIDGRTYLWSVGGAEVTDADGEVWPYAPGLADIEAAIGEDGISVEIADDSVNWPALAIEIEGQPVTLRRWDGVSLREAAIVYASGEARGVTHGSRYQSVSFAITRRTGADTLGVQIPDAAAVIDRDTWPVAGGGAVGNKGAIYPLVFGYPGYTGSGTPTPVVPVPLAQHTSSVSTTYVVVHEDGGQDITEIRLLNAETRRAATETVIATQDLLGRPIRVANFANDNSPKPDSESYENAELYAGYSPSGGGGPRTVSAVLRYLMRRWGSQSVDWARLPEIEELFDAYYVDTWIDETVTDPWAWVEDVIVPHLPVEVRTSERGRYFVRKRYRTETGATVRTFRARENCERASDVEIDSDGLCNEFVAKFRMDRDGEYTTRIMLTGERLSSVYVAEPGSVRKSRICEASFARYGLRQSEDGPLEIDWTWDEGTVLRILQDQAERYALPSRMVDYNLAPDEEVQEGDQVRIVDDEVGLDHDAIIESPPLASSTALRVTLRIPLES